jgi:pyruvate dehydrogenase E2 component (dihydrolipoamide acetyltransferase)
MRLFTPMPSPGAFRKIAASTWRKPTNPQLFGSGDIDFTAAYAFIERYNTRYGVRLTPTHLVGRAAGLILARFPQANARTGMWRLWLRNSADVYFLIAAESGADLFGTKVIAADRVSLADLERTLRAAEKRIGDGTDIGFVRSRRLMLALPLFLLRPLIALTSFIANELQFDLSAAGFARDAFGGAMITSLGMFGLETGFAALSPTSRSSMCYAIMQIRQRPWVVGDRIEPRPVIRICATFDHRILDGYLAGQVAREMEDLISHPEKLLTEAERADFREDDRLAGSAPA